jgi:hypothetical protein
LLRVVFALRRGQDRVSVAGSSCRTGFNLQTGWVVRIGSGYFITRNSFLQFYVVKSSRRGCKTTAQKNEEEKSMVLNSEFDDGTVADDDAIVHIF